MACIVEPIPMEYWEKENKKLISLLKELNLPIKNFENGYTLNAYEDYTKKLCTYCQTNNIDDNPEDYSSELRIWWLKHKEKDRKNLLSKLNVLKHHIQIDAEKEYQKKKKEFILSLPEYEQSLIKSEL